MRDGDRQRFVMALEALAATFRAEASEAMLEGYWMALDDLPIEAVVFAVRSAMRGCERMPTGAELRKLTGEMTNDTRAVHAWGALSKAVAQHGAYASVSFDDPVINATVRNLGGWQKLCATDVEELKWVRRDFERIYASLCVSGVSAESTAHMAGIHEQNNAAKGFLSPAPVAIRTGLPPHRDGVVRGELAPASNGEVSVGQLVGQVAKHMGLTSSKPVPPPAFDDEKGAA